MDIRETLDLFKIEYSQHGHDLHAYCYACGGEHLSISVETGMFNCHTCHQASGPSLDKYLQNMVRCSPEQLKRILLEGVSNSYKRHDIEKAYEIMQKERGLTKETVDKFQLSATYDNHIEIPVFDGPSFIGLRTWVPKGERGEQITTAPKVTDSTEYSVLFNAADMQADKICYITEGEVDCMKLAQQLGDTAAAVSGLRGAGSLPENCLHYFKDLDVRILYDNDDAGYRGVVTLFKKLNGLAKSIKYLQWPDVAEDAEDFSSTKIPWETLHKMFIPCDALLYEQGAKGKEKTQLKHIINKHTIDSVQTVDAEIGMVSNSKLFIVPAIVRCHCSNQESMDDNCVKCPLHAGEITKSICERPAELLKYIGVNEIQKLKMAVRDTIFNDCKFAKAKTISHRNLRQIFFDQYIPDSEMALDDVSNVTGGVLGYTLDVNINSDEAPSQSLVLHPVVNPKDNTKCYICSAAKPIEGVLDNFHITPEVISAIENHQKITLQEYVDEYAEAVLGIYGRHTFVRALLLVYGSVMRFDFLNDSDPRGWMEAAVIGDTSQGKTTAVRGLLRFLRLGAIVSGKSTKRTGLTYATTQLPNGEWHATYGVLVRQDRKLVVIDEFGGLDAESVKQLTEVRSSGQVSINNVTTGRRNARTRIIYLANPKEGHKLQQDLFGIDAITRAFGAPEDIRRTDLMCALAENTLDNDELNHFRVHRRDTPDKFTAESERLFFTWVWTRLSKNIQIDSDATAIILEEAKKISDLTKNTVPFLIQEDLPKKIARTAVSIGALTGSVSADYENILVTKEVAQMAVGVYNDMITDDTLGINTRARMDAGDHMDPIKFQMLLADDTFATGNISQMSVSEQAAAQRAGILTIDERGKPKFTTKARIAMADYRKSELTKM